MGSFSIWHLLVVLVIVVLVFGAGKLPSVMGDMAKGVKAFKKGLNDESQQPPAAGHVEARKESEPSKPV